MLLPVVPLWKQAPFIRLLAPLMAGISIQWYFPLSLLQAGIITFISFAVFICVNFLKGYFLYSYKWVGAIGLMVMVAMLAVFITQRKNITHQQNWFGNFYTDTTTIIVSLAEPLIEKNKSYKAIADVYALAGNHKNYVKGNIIIYFKKDSLIARQLRYGSTIIFKKKLQSIESTGNPGAFDYKRYCLFQGITHQVFLSGNEFSISPVLLQPWYKSQLQYSRKALLEILQKYIPGKKEAGVAEALLVGYREDLDRDLVQSYANTGVVHIIAISGMHLAMIYGLLIVLLKPLERFPGTKWLRGLIILLVLWSFTFLSGAGPSILRSAVMFSFIVAGESMAKRISIYHTLSASAFFLLCWNPFFLWDVGFQLSYAAVLSIVVFLKPVTNWFYCKNKIGYYIWKLTAVTISAQILTTPLSIYHFHQIPNLFLVSNLFIVPLSGIILYGEIILCFFSAWSPAAILTGKLIDFLLRIMNYFIQWVDSIPFAVSNNISISMIQVVLLYVFIVTISMWLMRRWNNMLKYAIFSLLFFVLYRTTDIIKKERQQKMIVYNIPKHRAIDIIHGTAYCFIGDQEIQADNFLNNFYLNPSRLLYRAVSVKAVKNINTDSSVLFFNNKRILIPGNIPGNQVLSKPVDVDIIILSKNTNTRISHMQHIFHCPQYVFDASCPAWKIREWKNECDSLHLRGHSVEEKGAFILD